MKSWLMGILACALLLTSGQGFSACAQEEEGEALAESVKLWGDMEVAVAFLDTRVDGSTATIPMMNAVREKIRYWEAVEHSTTPVAYERLCKGDVDLILVTPPSAEDLEIARAAGMELEVVPVAREALVFLNNTQNPVTSLTQEQLRDIYMGRITNWREVDGNDAPIMPYQRDTRSGSQTLFLDCLMRGQEPMTPEKDLVTDSMGRLIDQVSGFDNAQHSLGYSVFYYANRMYLSETVRVLAVDGVVPSVRTIEDGSYPLCTGYFAVLRKDAPRESLARQLVDWLLTAEGQDLLSMAGYGRLLEEENPALTHYDWADTHISSGTGGTQPRQHEVLSEYGHQKMAVPEDIAAMAREWDAQVGRELAEIPTQIWESSLQSSKMPAPLTEEEREGQFQRWLNGDVVSSVFLNLARTKELDDYGDEYALRTAVIDMEQQRFLQLSDLFYDGFNYIDYVNKHLTFANRRTNVDDYSISPWIEWGERVFSGLPKDYPYFRMYSRIYDEQCIEILYDSDNPFWRRQDSGMYPLRAFVPLAHWVSPWGGCIVSTVYQERTLPGDTKFIAPALRIDEGREPEAEAQINAALAACSERLIGEQTQWQTREDYSVSVYTRYAGQHVLVTYWLEGMMSEGSGTIRPLSMQLFNLHTGEGEDLETVFAQWNSSPQARYFSDFEFYGYENGQRLLAGYQPPEGIEMTYAMVRDYEGERALCIEFKEPGREDRADRITMELPLAALGW